MRRRAVLPEVLAYRAAISVCIKRQQHQQTLRLVRAMLRQAGMPGVAIYSAAISVCGRASSTSRPAGTAGRHAFAPEWIAGRAAISASDKRRLHQLALRLLRAVPCQAIEPDVATVRAATSAGEEGQQR